MVSNVSQDLSLPTLDSDVYSLCQAEKQRQRHHLELIASENFACRAVLEALSSSFHNKYSEGYPGARYYGGTEIVDKLEILCQNRALKLYELDPAKWGVNVQPYSGSPGNLAIYLALAGVNGRIMGLDLPDGGHLTHGYQSANKKVSATSQFFESLPYKVNIETGLIDYDELERTAKLFRPKLIIAGISCYSRELDYARFRKICDSVGALLIADMAHVSGLVAAKLIQSPFVYADVVSTTTHKSLRGPRAGLIFFRRVRIDSLGKPSIYPVNLEKSINEAVFPGLQGGPHNNTIAAIAVALKLAAAPEFVEYQNQVILNCRIMADEFKRLGYKIVTGGTDVHLLLVDFRPQSLDGNRLSYIFDQVNIIANKNACPGDKSVIRPSGVRFGTPALTSRGLKSEHMVTVVGFIHEAVQLALSVIQSQLQDSSLNVFKQAISNDSVIQDKIKNLRNKVFEFAGSFPIPGFDDF